MRARDIMGQTYRCTSRSWSLRGRTVRALAALDHEGTARERELRPEEEIWAGTPVAVEVEGRPAVYVVRVSELAGAL